MEFNMDEQIESVKKMLTLYYKERKYVELTLKIEAGKIVLVEEKTKHKI